MELLDWCNKVWLKWHGIFVIIEWNTAEALAGEVSEENFEKGLIFPPFTDIRKISAQIAAKVAAKAYELGKLLLSYHTICFSSLK